MSDAAPSPPADPTERLQFWKHHAEARAPHATWFFHTDLDRACDVIDILRAINAELRASLRMMEAAKERAEAINAELLAALIRMRAITHQHISPACDAADAAIAKAKGEAT